MQHIGDHNFVANAKAEKIKVLIQLLFKRAKVTSNITDQWLNIDSNGIR